MMVRVWLLLLRLLALHCLRAELLLLLLLLRNTSCTSRWRTTAHLLLLALLASSRVHGHARL
jgi:hypothetical protein